MADSLAEVVMNGGVVPSSRTELEKWVLSFRGVPVAATWTRAAMPPRCEERTSIFEKTEELLVSVLEPKELKSLRIATLNVLTLGPAEEREANGLRIPARQARLANTSQEAGIEIIGLQECRLPVQVVVRRFCHDHV